MWSDIFVQWSAEVSLGVTTLLRDGSSISLSFVFSGSSSELELDKVNGRKICTYDIRTRNEKASYNTMYIPELYHYSVHQHNVSGYIQSHEINMYMIRFVCSMH